MATVTNAHPQALLISQAEAAHLLGVERTMIWRMAKRGDLDVVHIGRRALVSRASLDRFIGSQTERH